MECIEVVIKCLRGGYIVFGGGDRVFRGGYRVFRVVMVCLEMVCMECLVIFIVFSGGYIVLEVFIEHLSDPSPNNRVLYPAQVFSGGYKVFRDGV